MNNFITSKNNEKTNNHTAGNKISKTESIKNKISEGELMFEFFIIDQEKVREAEKKEIEKYIEYYGEKPPLNG